MTRSDETVLEWKPPPPFSSDPEFLRNYYKRTAIFMFVTVVTLVALRMTSFYSPEKIFPPASGLGFLVVFFASLYLGMLSATLIHNAAHSLFRGRLLNNIVGELAGLQQLYGFQAWKIAHIIHHRHSDNPNLDPHFPGRMNFVSYSLRTMPMINQKLRFFYFRHWGVTEKTRKSWQQMSFFWWSSLLLKMLFLFLFLGKNGFLFVYLPSYFSVIFFFGVVNYYGHRPGLDGKYHPVNLKSWIFVFLNKFLFGVFSHADHHLHPNRFNPTHGGSTGK